MNHFILKLTSGELLYGVIDLENTDKKMVTLENPLTWEEYETADGHQGSAMVKYIAGTSETKVPIATHAIISMTAMSPNFINFYDAAVAVQMITDEAYDEKLKYMTGKMASMVLEYQAKEYASKVDGIVSYTDTTTIH